MDDHKTKRAPNEKPVSLAPLTPDEALAAALQVKPEDMKKAEAAAQKKKPTRKK